ncbi:MAG: LacI family transcriptional regulator [Actinomycetia bacterium]|nr:LacI family transcriptional regulator [Actinomycetes bacterium]
MGRKSPTLRDVGALAGVDPSTVSRLVNYDPRLSVSPETRERILAAIEELGYRPNANARRLRLSRTMAVGYLIPDLVNPVNGPLVRGAQVRAGDAGYAILIGSSADSQESSRAFTELLGEGRVDGLLVNCGVMSDDEVLALATASAPVVLVNRSVQGARASVVLQDEQAAAVGAAHLIDLGHRSVLHLAGPTYADTTQRRVRGFGAAMRAAGSSVHLQHADDWTDGAGFARAADALSQLRGEVTAVFADNVSLAIGVCSAARGLGLSVPADLSVLAMHDVPLAVHVTPSLTAIATPLEELGATAFTLLHEMIAGKEPAAVTVVDGPAPRLIRRDSTAPPATRPN